MGSGVSKRVVPVAQISVQPAPEQSATEEGGGEGGKVEREGASSLESSMRTTHSGAGQHTSSDSKSATPRAGSQLSRRNYSGRARETWGRGYPRKASGGRRFGRAGGLLSHHNTSSAKRFSWQGERGVTSASGLPLQRDLDLNSSGHAQRANPVAIRMSSPSDADYGTVVLLRSDTTPSTGQAATCCQLCGYDFNTLRVPFLLLCGHSYCGPCIDRATEDYPSALKCGVCSIVTPLGQQNADTLPRNESILDLVTSREFTAMVNEKNVEKCAECIHHPASVFCSECSASYCDNCAKKAHEGSRVRSKHKPVPVNLKPRPQPTCRKHPGQSCVLYCETEKQPMCVLCKFYNQHRFHKFDLLSKVASKYTTSVTDKLSQLERMEQDLNTAARSLAQAVEEVNSNARKAQERLERHFGDLQRSYCTSLERREAVLLTLLDRQVELKQDMIEEARTEVAAARARIIAAKEEAGQLLKLNPVSALLSRKHMDANFNKALKRTMLVIKPPTQPEVPLSLLPDIAPTISQALGQHGAVLQLAPKPSFLDISVTTNTISLKWESPPEFTSDVTADRTLTFSLHCHADIPFKMKSKISFKKQIMSNWKQPTPESGFEDFSETNSNFPSVPQSLLGSRNISLIGLGRAETHDSGLAKPTNHDAGPRSHDPATPNQKLVLDSVSGTDLLSGPSRSKVDGGKGKEGLPKMLLEPGRLPKPLPKTGADTKLPEVVKPGLGGRAAPSLLPPSLLPSSSSAARLNLPPLRQTHETLAEMETDQLSDSTTVSGTLADSEDPRHSSTPENKTLTSPGPKTPHTGATTCTTSSSSTLSESSTDVHDSTFTNVGRFCKGFAFDEIYCGEDICFHYSGLLPGATYYFRVRCHNAAGWGPWSDTVKCTTALVSRK